MLAINVRPGFLVQFAFAELVSERIFDGNASNASLASNCWDTQSKHGVTCDLGELAIKSSNTTNYDDSQKIFTYKLNENKIKAKIV